MKPRVEWGGSQTGGERAGCGHLGLCPTGMGVEVDGRELWSWWRWTCRSEGMAGNGARPPGTPETQERREKTKIESEKFWEGKGRVKRPVRAEPLWKHGRQLEKI